MEKFPVSACIIAKNSEKTIEKCLNSLIIFFKEIIVIDTGSTDSTLDIAKTYTNKVYSFNWNNNFSEARNEAFSYIEQPWILWIDSDEEFILNNKEKFNDILSNKNFNSFSIKIENILDDNNISEIYRYRIFRTSKNYLFKGYIHEVPNIDLETNYQIEKGIAYIKHYGYNSKYIDLKEKNRRNLDILNANKNNITNEWEMIYHLISLSKEMNNPVEKNKILIEAENLINNFSSKEIKKQVIITSFFQEIIKNYSELEVEDLEKEYCNKALEYFPTDINLLSANGNFYYRKKDYNKSLIFFEKIEFLVMTDSYLKDVYIDSSVKNYGTFYNISLCYYQLNDIEKSLYYLQLSLKSKPDFTFAVRFMNYLLNKS